MQEPLVPPNCEPVPDVSTIILIAHERKRLELIKLMKTRRPVFEAYRLLATAETGEVIERELGLEVSYPFSGRAGGEIQLCGLVCTNVIRAVYFLRDPLETRPDEPDIAPFYRVCDMHNVPLATNVVTAVALTHWLGRKIRSESQPDKS